MGPGEKIFSRVFHPRCFHSFAKQWKILFFTYFSFLCFPSSIKSPQPNTVLNKETKLLLLNRGMKSKEKKKTYPKKKRIKKRKKKRAKTVQWQEGLKEAEGKEKELREEKEEECKAQVLNEGRESERERERVTCVSL